MTPRSCGPCTACCTTMSVPELDKGAHCKCEHELRGQGCAVYNVRPPSCRGFECLWLKDPRQEVFRNMERPDHIGIVFDVTPADAAFNRATGQQAVIAREVWAGAATGPGRHVIERVAAKMLVVIVTPDDRRRFVGPPPLVRAAEEVTRVTARNNQ